MEKLFDLAVQPGTGAQILREQPCKKAGGAVVVKRAAQAVGAKKMKVLIPILLGIIGQLCTYRLLIQLVDLCIGTHTKYLPQLLVVTVFKQSKLECEQSILPRIHVHTVDVLRLVKQVIEGVATSAGDHHNPAIGVKLQELAITAGVFPAGIIYQLTLMNAAEYPVAQVVNVLHGSVYFVLTSEDKVVTAI